MFDTESKDSPRNEHTGIPEWKSSTGWLAFSLSLSVSLGHAGMDLLMCYRLLECAFSNLDGIDRYHLPEPGLSRITMSL